MTSPRFGETFEIKDVPGRSHILFHTGNTVEDTQGCILLGRSLWNAKNGIRESKPAFADFMEALKGKNKFTLIVENNK